ncbi:MAG TPA: DUF4838 domain-containing protein [Chthoniobacteraceae bacterium]|nr:DUF4838 domain-containing protein [Chthoniobacteraceae bacterium]
MAALSAIGLALPGMLAAQEFTLVRNHEAKAVVVISNREEVEKFSPRGETRLLETAEELISLVEQMSGVRLDLVRRDPSLVLSREEEQKLYQGKAPIYLGEMALSKIPSADLKKAVAEKAGFLISASPEALAIAGGTPRGTEIGVHALLEGFGVRWYFPGHLGTVIPKAERLAVPVGERLEHPSFQARHFAQIRQSDEWVRHQRTGGPYFPGAHTLKLGRGISPETHPELYALVDGVRKGPQHCLSNPETLRLAVDYARTYFREHPEEPWLGMGPADASGYCQCSGCTALDGGDWDPFSNEISVTDRYLWFFNRILEGLHDEFPEKKIAFYIYHNYLRPPVKVQPDPKIVGALAPIGLCRIHGLNNPLCPEKGYLKALVEKWRGLLPELYERSYWFNLADPGMLFIQMHRLGDEIKWYASQGIKGFRTEVTEQWAFQGPSLWIAGKLMWNAASDVDALLDDFCEHLFGPAAGPMKSYFTCLDAALRDADHHTGSAFDLLRFYPEPVRQKAEGYLKQAQAVATASPYRERLEVFAEGFRFNEAFASMITHRDAQEWQAAEKELKAMDEIAARLRACNPPLVSNHPEAFLRRFFRLPVEQGHARSSGGNRVVAPLVDEWEMLLDPQSVGEDLRYFSPRAKGGNWRKTPTFSTTWSELGLRYYKGLAWFRQEITVPRESAGKRMFLWCGGVDETARIWVNGKRVGTSPSSAFTPFEVDATNAVVEGRNLVVLCVANRRVDELGTGGITAPGFLYLPVKGDAAELANIKPLRNTFP